MLSLQTTQELFDQNLSYLEGQLGQTAPTHEKAFLRVLAGMLALLGKSFNQLAIERTKQNLVMTAGGDSLVNLGTEYVVPIKLAVQAVMTATISTTVDVPANRVFVSDSNKQLYKTTALATASGGSATLSLQSVEAGADYTLAVDDTLTIQVPLYGCENTAIVTAIDTDGLDEEEDTPYRRRIQNEIRTVGGGGNSADYRTWAEAVEGVERAFPYSGSPVRQSYQYNDLNMEESGTSYWSTEGGATLSKETGSPYEGTQCLRVTRVSSNPAAYQNIITQYHKYRITGVARGDGTAYPAIYFGTQLIWTGTTSTSWQAFDEEFIAASATYSTRMRLFSLGGAATNYSEFDNIELLYLDLPGLNTIYIECSTDLDADGIPDSDLLDDVKAAILANPDTTIHRPPLGILDENIYVEPISVTTVNLEIRGLSVDAEVESQVQDEIEDTVDTYLRAIVPFIQGLDSPYSDNSTLTDLTLSQEIQGVLTPYGGSAEGIGISIEAGSFISAYIVGAGEKLKLGTISYV